jgi:hypothetical protein
VLQAINGTGIPNAIEQPQPPSAVFGFAVARRMEVAGTLLIKSEALNSGLTEKDRMSKGFLVSRRMREARGGY